MIAVSPELLHFGRLLPLRPGSKRPWIGDVIHGASNDSFQIEAWQHEKPGCSWGLRIDSRELIVLDLEAPGKGSAFGGARELDWIECEQGQRLPDGPVATTQSGGEHRYFRLPASYHGRIRNWTQALPGIDIRVRGGMVCIPPSQGREWIESFDDVDLPELPGWLCELVLAGRAQSSTHTGQTETVSEKGNQDQVAFIPHFPGAGIKKGQWFNLFGSSGESVGNWGAQALV